MRRTERYQLFCPGPVNVLPSVAGALTSATIGHREVEFEQLYADILVNLLEIEGLSSQAYQAVVITGSGSSANEAVLSSAIGVDERVLALSNGEFGRRLGEISSIFNDRTQVLSCEWGEALPLDRVESLLAAGGIDWVTMVHHETSTGLLQPVEAVASLCRRYGAKLFVDMVSSFAVDSLDLSLVDFATTSAGKAIGMYPGLSVVYGRRAHFEALLGVKPRSYYLDLGRHYRFARDHRQTPNTPAVQLFLALDESLRLLREEGLSARIARQARKADYMRQRMGERGVKPHFTAGVLSNALTTFALPDGVSFAQIRAHLRSHGYIIYGGKGPLMDRVVQVSTMGEISMDEIDRFLVAWDALLH